ncbi:putative multi-domain protein [hydrothermal vent metagenome]|uniref:Putative multi-domain protein n=1 Tax=hydrothermal vent metagenome TaxID=652676 RepID=A0A3B1BJT3_9ZZZZ
MKKQNLNNSIKKTLLVVLGISALLFSLQCLAQDDKNKSESTAIWEPVPVVVTPGVGTAPPSDAIVLFDGKNMNEWESTKGGPSKWKLGDGAMTVVKKTGSIRTKKAFGDCQLHIEWRTPAVVVGDSQERGNSGIFLQERYELQVLDSYNNKTYVNGQAGAIYKQHIPLVNACRPPGVWQTYDIIYTAPVFKEDGTVEKPAYFTVLQNGVLIQNHVEVKGNTVHSGQPHYEKHNQKEPLALQDHGNPVSYRNIWIREL